MICRECGADNREDLAFCANCGAGLTVRQEQDPASRKKLYLLLGLGALVVLLTAILITCLLSPRAYERDAKSFVKAVLQNDMDTVEELMAPSVYAYAGSSLDWGESVNRCKVKVRSSEIMGSVPLLNYNELLVNLDSGQKMTEAYYVTVDYRAEYGGQELEDELVVVMGRIGEEWYVITLESS